MKSLSEILEDGSWSILENRLIISFSFFSLEEDAGSNEVTGSSMLSWSEVSDSVYETVSE